MLTSLMLLSFLNTSDAVPLQLTQQGRVLDNNGASVTGAHDLTFRIYDASSGGSVYWSETLTVNFSNGYYAAILGTDEQNNPLDSSTLSLYPLYLEVQLDNNAPMTTRYSINSAPYAQMAGNAEVATSVDGGSVNATEVSINASQVIDGNGNWVGQPITVDWNNIDPNTIPSYIADGDDNTQLSEGQVEGYITNDVINLAAGSQVGGSDIVTVATDSDTLADLSCSTAEIAGWDGSSWVCTSDNTLTVSDVSTMLSNNSVDLNLGTTVGGLAILTEVDDSDTLANLSCANDGEIARYDLVLDEWYCDADIDTVLDENTVETYVTNGAIDLDANTTIGGNPILTTITDSDVLAALGCNDGEVAKYDAGNAAWGCGSDDNTQLTQSDVLNNVTGQQLALGSGTTVGGSNVLTQPNACTDSQVLVYNLSTASWACGADTDTTLSASEVQAMVEAVSGLALQAGATVDGSPVLTEASSIGSSQLDGTAGTAGQVLTTDGSTVSWDDASGGSGALVSPVTLGESDGGDAYNSQDTPLTIPDNNSVGITSVRYVSDSLTVDTLSIDLQMSHGDLGELTVTLTSPLGTTLTIYDGGNPGESTFDDNIGWNVDFNSGNLYSYNGESTQGTWMLSVVDVTNGNTGTLDAWTMRFNENWDGEMFIGSDLTVQGTARIRTELRVEYGGSLVFSDEEGNETLHLQPETGSGLVPAGVIVMWSGTSSNIPDGWALCDGNNGTPNLTDRFIVAAGGDYSSGTYGSPSLSTSTTTVMSGWYPNYISRRTVLSDGNISDVVPKYYALAFIMKI